MAELVAVWLWRVISPVFLLLGGIGNILCIVVLIRPGTVKSSTAVFLTALAVCDTSFLYTGLLRWWILECFGQDVRLLSDVGCRLHWYSIYVTSALSSWLLVGVTCERITCIKWPHRVRVICTQTTARCTVFAMTAVFCIGNSHILYGTRLQYHASNVMRNDTSDVTITTWPFNNQSQTRVSAHWECKAKHGSSYSTFFNYYYPWIDMCSYFLLPAICLTGGEMYMLIEIYRSRRLRRSMQQNDVRTNRKSRDRTNSVTIMLLTVNAVFVLCTTPISVFLIGEPYWIDPNDNLSKNLAWTIVNLFMYLHHSVNFALYFLSGARFRRKAREFFIRKCRGLEVNGLAADTDSDYRPNNAHSQKPSLDRKQSSLPNISSSYVNSPSLQDEFPFSYPDIRPSEADISPINTDVHFVQTGSQDRKVGRFSTPFDIPLSHPDIRSTEIFAVSTKAAIHFINLDNRSSKADTAAIDIPLSNTDTSIRPT